MVSQNPNTGYVQIGDVIERPSDDSSVQRAVVVDLEPGTAYPVHIARISDYDTDKRTLSFPGGILPVNLVASPDDKRWTLDEIVTGLEPFLTEEVAETLGRVISGKMNWQISVWTHL